MGSINIYNQETDSTFTVTFDLKSSILSEDNGTATGLVEYYLDVYTTLRLPDGSSFGHSLVRTLDDVPPGASTATDFSDLCKKYIDYYINESKIIDSSSSSSNSSSSSSSNSSSSSIDSSSSSSSSSGPH